MAKRKPKERQSNNQALGFEAQLWAAADKMRGHMDASEYKHVCLGLIFLKYISDAFEEKREQLLFGFADPKSEWFIKDEPQRTDAAENRDEYLAANVFWLPPEARWHTINAKAKSPEIGKIIDDAMGAIEREIRKAGIEADLVDCIVALPGQLFFTTQIPVRLWFLARDKKNHKHRDRRGNTLFIDARKTGVLVDRIHRELAVEEVSKIADTYHAWRSPVAAVYDRPTSDAKKTGAHRAPLEKYEDTPGFCKSVALEEIRKHDYVLTPGRYVGAAELQDDGEPFEQKMKRLTATLEEQFAESAKLEKVIKSKLQKLIYEA